MKFWSCIFHVLLQMLVCSIINSVLATSFAYESDRLALLAVKDHIDDDPHGALDSWNNQSIYHCDWYGITCSRRHPNRVVGLVLESKELGGAGCSSNSVSGWASRRKKFWDGILYRVVRSNLVLADFGDDFHLQHSPHHKYDVSFSFDRVCLKRAHQAVAEINDTLLNNFLFPRHTSRDSFLYPSWSIIASHQNSNKETATAVCTVSMLNTPPPYLVEGPLSVYVTRTRLGNGATIVDGKPTKTGLFIKEAVIAICRTSPNCRILINAPTNITCDVLMRSLREKIPESDMFRANAAFRERCDVLDDILPLCPFEGECFTCPLREELRNYQVVLSTYVSSYRLYKEGISAGHFTHIFLVDASSTTEPETMVALGNLADEKTVVVVSGSIRNSSNWVRSVIGRENGLRTSYFQRLFESEPWCCGDPMFVTRIP